METVTITELILSISGIYICKFYDCAKFHYHQIIGNKAIINQNSQILVSGHLNPFERCAPVLAPEAKKSEKIEITYFWPEMTFVR